MVHVVNRIDLEKCAKNAQRPRPDPRGLPGFPAAPRSSAMPGAIHPLALELRAPSRSTPGRSPRIHSANGSRKPCFGRSYELGGSGRASVSCSRRLLRMRPGCAPRLGPDRREQLVIDERHAHFERVSHRHRVDVAQQLRTQIVRASRAARPSPPASRTEHRRSSACSARRATRRAPPAAGSASAGPTRRALRRGMKSPRCARYTLGGIVAAAAKCRHLRAPPRRQARVSAAVQARPAAGLSSLQAHGAGHAAERRIAAEQLVGRRCPTAPPSSRSDATARDT